MFEKFSNLEIDSAGRGGEYTVQAGFGWTNGVALWIAHTYGSVLDAPACPDITADAVPGGGNIIQDSAAFRVGASPGSVTAVAILAIVVSGMMS
jgi:alpha,alpha-trehalase